MVKQTFDHVLGNENGHYNDAIVQHTSKCLGKKQKMPKKSTKQRPYYYNDLILLKKKYIYT